MVVIPIAAIILIAQAASCPTSPAGRYSDGRDYVVDLAFERYGFAIRPVHSTAKQAWREAAPDSLIVIDRPERSARIKRSGACVTGLTLVGFDGATRELTPVSGPPSAIEQLYEGDPRAAARAFRS